MSEPLDAEVVERARRVRVVVFDVDGVLTDGRIYLSSDGAEQRAFHVHDGLGIKSLRRAGIEVAVLSARRSTLVEQRMRELGVTHVIQGSGDKAGGLAELLRELALEPGQACFVGDDLPDLGAMAKAGLAVAVANATPVVADRAHWRTRAKGGRGAAREVCDLILTAQGRMDDILDAHTPRSS